MQLKATLNNTSVNNSSPTFSTVPTPFYCINVLEEYNQGAVDPDADSLSFSLVPGIDARYNTPVTYIAPYTATAPLGTISGGFSFNSYNGQMTFTPNLTQRALIVNQVSEYRHGVLVGTSEREMAFVVNDGCTGTPPTATITDLNGASVTDSSNVINICKGAPLVTFDIHINNPDGDTTYLTASGVPGDASLTFTGSGTPSPSAHFSWATDTLSPGIYSFVLTIKNNHCPISNTQTIAYTINVVNFPTISASLVHPTQCVHQAAVQYHINGGFLPRIIEVVEGGTIIKTLVDSVGTDSAIVINDSLAAGNYIIIVNSDSFCSASCSFTVADSGIIKVDTAYYSTCVGALPYVFNITPVTAGATINYYTIDGTRLGAPPTVYTGSAATYTWNYIEQYHSCASLATALTATVHSLPDAEIIDIPQTVCYGDKIYLKATGGVQYIWNPTDLINVDTGGNNIIVYTPVTLTVDVTDQYNCEDSATVSYSDIQQCCNFSFPTAFTPNDDGKNDDFRVVTYGNMQQFNITIYDRFGEIVYISSDPAKGWDGKLHGVPCQVGTYYYLMNAQCLTGPKKFYKGDVTLIR